MILLWIIGALAAFTAWWRIGLAVIVTAFNHMGEPIDPEDTFERWVVAGCAVAWPLTWLVIATDRDMHPKRVRRGSWLYRYLKSREVVS